MAFVSLSALLSAAPRDDDALSVAVESLGLISAGDVVVAQSEAVPLKPRFIVPAGVKPKKSTVGARETPLRRVEKLIDGLQVPIEQIDALFDDIARAPDPFRSLLNLAHLSDAAPNRGELWAHLEENPLARARLMKLLSWSQALADTLIGEPSLLSQLENFASVSRRQLREMARQTIELQPNRVAKLETLRRFRRHQTLRIGLLDLERDTWRDEADFSLVVGQISDLAQVCVEQTLNVIAPQSTLDGEFCVLAMGKMGARELNYSSDIDLIFLHDGDNAAMQKLGADLFKELNAQTAAGHLHRVDMRLRPEGQSGPLVTPISYALSYYESYAEPWEWQALIKARVVAGSAKLGRRFRRFTRGVTWARRADDNHLRAVVEMKRRSEATPDGSDARNVKQGPGAIRDAEWVVQQLQMMTGPQHPRARVKATLQALKVLRDFDALSFEEAAALREGYLFLRVIEHRLQLWQERAVRIVPNDTIEKAVLARRLGCAWRDEAAARWMDEEHSRHRKAIRALCEKLFWGWKDTKEADDSKPEIQPSHGDSLDSGASLALSPAAQMRLRILADGSPTHPLPAPLSRQIRAALPGALRALNLAADPERAILNLERLSESSGNRLSLLRSLEGAPALSRAVFALLGGSQNLSDTLVRFPELLDLAAQRTLLERAKSWEEARSDCRSYCLTFRDREAALRRWKRREMLRIGLRDLALDASPIEIAREIADLCRATLDFAVGEVEARLQPNASRLGFAIIGMGKLGGGEMHYGSDADVIFVHSARDNYQGAAHLATQWATQLTRFMSERSEEGIVFSMDARLRPEGQSGALAPSLESFLKYFERTTGGIAIWERQALTRARFIAGDAQTGAQTVAAIRHVAFPETWNPAWSDELRHIKSRVENERAAKNPAQSTLAPLLAPLYDVKLGRGALSDIEWSAQWLALQHGHRCPPLRVPNTLAQIAAAQQCEVLSAPDATILRDAYLFLRRAELRLKITQEDAPAALREGSTAWRLWAHAIFPASSATSSAIEAAEQLRAQWQHHTQAAREIMERIQAAL